MGYKNFQTPFSSDKDIKRKVDLFRKKFGVSMEAMEIALNFEDYD